MNPACWKKVLKKVAFPKDLKYDMKSQPVDMNSVCIVDSSLSLGSRWIVACHFLVEQVLGYMQNSFQHCFGK